MTAQIRPNRMQVNDRFPMLGFAVRTAQPEVQAEVVLATAIDLFRPENRARRTAANFYSSREHGLLSVPRGEGVFVVPPEVLARFIGQDKLFFALATGRADQGGLKVDAAPREGSPYVSLSGFTGRTLRRSFAPARSAGPPLMEWTGDAAQPGSEPARTAQPVTANGSGTAPQPAGPAEYNDGFGELPELPARQAAFQERPQAAGDEPADARAVMPDLPGSARQRAARIGGAFAQRIHEALGLGLPEASVVPLLDTLEPSQRPVSSGDDLFATPQARAQEVSSSIHWPDVQLVNQPTDMSCWATTIAMLVGWHDQVSIAPQTIAEQAGKSIDKGLAWSEHRAVAQRLGLNPIPPQCYTAEGLYDLLESDGPLYVSKMASAANLSGHAVLVVGMYQDGGQWFVRIADPWDRSVGTPGTPGSYQSTHNTGSRYILRFEDFESEYELQAARDSSVGEANVQMFSLGVPAGRQPDRSGNPPAGFAMAAGMGVGSRWSIQWDEVQLTPQPTDNGCWATTLSMLIGWRDQVSIAPETIAQQCGKDIANGLPWAERQAAADALGLTAHPPQCYLPEGFKALIEHHGPLYVGKMASATNLSGHAVLVVGMYYDGANHFVRIADPWDRPVGTPGSPGGYAPTHDTGSRYIMKYEDFQAEYEMAAAGNPAYVQILSGGVPVGRSINRSTAAPAGYAMAAGERRAPPPPAPVRRGQGFDVGAAATIAGTAIEVISANSGDIATHLSNWSGVKHPGDRAPARQAPFHEGTVTLRDWPLVGGTFGIDDIYCWLQIRWQYNGTSLGRIYIEDIGHDDAAGWGLTVTATIEDDSRLYARSSQARAPGPAQVPALHINIQYVFDEVIADDQIANTRVTLYADGTYDVTSRWVQHSRPGGGDPTMVVRPFEHA
ncbi:hypothetical protein GRI75_03570 [Altererythrobacter soli]|uniref:Uncharacterized protein n=1 Tax=Croceibacterium soli TaxID=1739690 RepID=A0A6I4UT77_9SPHN|nr:papain-like cysteine protease family protein [Croceibacterium soli]MXP40727.1 hypothetical protein [Croceibacterium soli]